MGGGLAVGLDPVQGEKNTPIRRAFAPSREPLPRRREGRGRGRTEPGTKRERGMTVRDGERGIQSRPERRGGEFVVGVALNRGERSHHQGAWGTSEADLPTSKNSCPKRHAHGGGCWAKNSECCCFGCFGYCPSFVSTVSKGGRGTDQNKLIT